MATMNKKVATKNTIIERGGYRFTIPTDFLKTFHENATVVVSTTHGKKYLTNGILVDPSVLRNATQMESLHQLLESGWVMVLTPGG